MALFVKQDFTPPTLSRKWIAMKFRPNMLLYNRHHIISILESGLLFREDSIEVEQESPEAGELWAVAGGGASGWMTRGERVVSVFAVGTCVLVFPPRTLNRSTLAYFATYLAVPITIRYIHRRLCRGGLPALLSRMRDYLALARRAAACLRECKATRAQLGSVSSVIDSTHALLCRQQSELSVLMSRASSALLGNVPWLRSDVAWDAITQNDTDNPENLMKIHHAFLVVQSTLLKHIAMAHFMPPPKAQRLYKNHNERIYWIHNTLIKHLTEEFTDNYEALERMYRLLKNYGNADQNEPRKPGDAIKDTWLYSEVHNDIARTNLELKVALSKCNNLDLFLDSCALHKQELDLEVLNKDIDSLIEHITKSLSSAQSSQIRLKKLLSKFTKQNGHIDNAPELFNADDDDKNILKIEDREPIARDEVFYFVKTDDDVEVAQPSGDVTTGPGKKEKDATKIVLDELRRKLVNREDVMRERERQALAKTMPELKNNVPEFPRQINMDVLVKKGYITKLKASQEGSKPRLFRKYKIHTKPKEPKYKYRLKRHEYEKETDIKSSVYEANSKLNNKCRLLTFSYGKKLRTINIWHKKIEKEHNIINNNDFSDLSDGLSDVESVAINKAIHQAANFNNNYKENGDARNFKFSKRDLELTPSTSDDSDFDSENRVKLLKDVRRHRPMRKKNYPDKRSSISGTSNGTQISEPMDESLRPAQYTLGAGLAMASVLQVNSARFPTMAQEEVFIGDGEVSEDSGNDEDA
ncbi:hypothetical protein NE865_07467 [Phthorimaea operculella]|nr:hypothetical protein NE865_07467 [Phthorimaea operculella]